MKRFTDATQISILTKMMAYTRKTTKPKYQVLKDHEFGAWGEIW